MITNCPVFRDCVITKEFEKLLMFLANNYPNAYEDWKSHLRFTESDLK